MTVVSGPVTGEVARERDPASAPPPRRRNGLDDGMGRRAAWLVAPTVALLGIVIIYPVIKAVWMSIHQDSGLNAATGLFASGGLAGVNNYLHWLLQRCATSGGGYVACPPGTAGSQFYAALKVTLLFTVLCVVLETLLGFAFALVMNKSFKGRGLLRASVLVPWAIPTAVTAKLWFFIFAYDGIANKVLHTHILWTGSSTPAKAAVIIADTWKTTPFMALLILAGLQVIPSDVYEAAAIDGATKWQQFTKITLPLVRPALMVAVLFRTLDTLRIFDLPQILTGGGGGTTTLSMLVVQQIRQGFNSAAALSTITFLLIFFVAFLFVKFLGANVTAAQAPKVKKAG